jgi:Trp operon repressor
MMKKSTQNVLEILVKNIHTAEEFDQFFTDLLTPQEYEDLLDRVRICQELLKGKTVLQVSEKLSVASATVVRGNRVLKYGTGFAKKILGNP